MPPPPLLPEPTPGDLEEAPAPVPRPRPSLPLGDMDLMEELLVLPRPAPRPSPGLPDGDLMEGTGELLVLPRPTLMLTLGPTLMDTGTDMLLDTLWSPSEDPNKKLS